MDRRAFISSGVRTAVAGAGGLGLLAWSRGLASSDQLRKLQSAASIIPVVGDGKWVWKDPPQDETGYLEPRSYELNIGVELEGTGTARQIRATTPVPVEHPEQSIEDVKVETQGCQARLRQVSRDAGQLMMVAPGLGRGRRIGANARFRLTIRKDYRGFEKSTFPAQQPEVPRSAFRGAYMSDSPGIQVRNREVRQLADKVGGQIEHPWDKAKAYYEWVWENIEARVGPYTSVLKAIQNRIGDCEERAAVFVAFCRASGIPARLVWVPNHNWAEFYLADEQGKGHWVPVHTAAYSWFGWTGAHELVLQKGDNLRLPETGKRERLLTDWVQWQGGRPRARFFAELKPLPPSEGDDAGPGARSKAENGEWKRIGQHELDRYLRDA